MDPQSKPQPVTIVKPPFTFDRILKRPFKYYFRTGGVFFGLTMAANFMTSLTDAEGRKWMTDYPSFYFPGLLTKSMFYGAFWPAFIINGVTSPQSVFIFGHTAKKAEEEISKLMKEIEKTDVKMMANNNGVSIKYNQNK